MVIVSVLMLAILVEYIVKIVKPCLPDTRYPLPLIAAMVIGIGLAVLVHADVLSVLGFEPSNRLIAEIVTGFIIAGGSSGLHELIAKLRASRDDIAN